MAKLLALVVIITLAPLASGCDPDGKKQCAWYLVPDETRRDEPMAEGLIPVCARNLGKNKQDCRLQAQVGLARSAFGKKFRYVDMKVESPALPRIVSSIDFCE